MNDRRLSGKLEEVVTRRDALGRMGLVTVGLATTRVAGWPASWFS